MFKNKEEFKTEFSRRLVESYGCDVKDTHPTEKYLTLGTMVRDYASVNWRDCKNAAAEQDVKQVYYFSMEFLLGRMMRTNLKNLGIYDMVVEGLKELGIDYEEIENICDYIGCSAADRMYGLAYGTAQRGRSSGQTGTL